MYDTHTHTHTHTYSDTYILHTYIHIYIYIYSRRRTRWTWVVVTQSFTRYAIIRQQELSDDRITRETLSNNNPCPSSPSSTILRSAYMALNTLQQDWLL